MSIFKTLAFNSSCNRQHLPVLCVNHYSNNCPHVNSFSTVNTLSDRNYPYTYLIEKETEAQRLHDLITITKGVNGKTSLNGNIDRETPPISITYFSSFIYCFNLLDLVLISKYKLLVFLIT